MTESDSQIQDFLTRLASRAGTPGGGAASAMTGAIAAALSGMVGRLNDKKDGTPGPLHGSITTADTLRNDLARLIDEDIAAFERLCETWKLSTNDAAGRAARQSATIEATESPLEIMSKALFVMKMAGIALERSKQGCVSDAGVSAILAHAAIEGARLNVLINLPGIEDSVRRSELHQRCESLHVSAAALRREIDALIHRRFDADSAASTHG
ncbi:MAG: cyclodeaminase/cyclohydrolase family protein [Phycisphaerae bacterium]|nr:cyclodeaminase/cyclohydrolase family protein [Phycisphaerae bacterium]